MRNPAYNSETSARETARELWLNSIEKLSMFRSMTFDDFADFYKDSYLVDPPLQVKVLPLQCPDFANAQAQAHRNHDHHLNVVRKLREDRDTCIAFTAVAVANARASGNGSNRSFRPRKWSPWA
ncbi:MAG TPA: hypothetical protein VKN18_19625 [Blastocatellia bacterium]|nr:hypothetical protein [Blastocatellia bacterium]